MAHDIGCQHRHAAAVALQTHSELRAFALCHQDRRGSACTLSTAQPRARGSYRGGALLGILAKMPELLTPPSAVVLNERKFPVITENPTWSQIFGNLRNDEYVLLAGATAVGAPWGYMLGWRYNVQGMSSKLGMFLFGAAALAHVTMASTARLLGITENGPEVQAATSPSGK